MNNYKTIRVIETGEILNPADFTLYACGTIEGTVFEYSEYGNYIEEKQVLKKDEWEWVEEKMNVSSLTYEKSETRYKNRLTFDNKVESFRKSLLPFPTEYSNDYSILQLRVGIAYGLKNTDRSHFGAKTEQLRKTLSQMLELNNHMFIVVFSSINDTNWNAVDKINGIDVKKWSDSLIDSMLNKYLNRFKNNESIEGKEKPKILDIDASILVDIAKYQYERELKIEEYSSKLSTELNLD
jgi:hypothetical protein